MTRLAPADRLFLFTDGITETMRSDGQEFGEGGLLHAARTGAELAPSHLKTHVVGRVNQFCNSQLHDDARLMAIAALDARDSAAHTSAEDRGIALAFNR